MIAFLGTFLASLGAAAVLTVLVRQLAYARSWFDHASSSRKVHTRPVPRLGGIAIVGGFFAPLLIWLVARPEAVNSLSIAPRLVWGICGGGVLIAILGLYDDLVGSKAWAKFCVQFLVALGLWSLGLRVERIANPFGAEIHLGLFGLPFTLLWIVGVVNAMNLIDGLDGLAGGVAFFAVATNFVLAISRGETLLGVSMAALAGAILGFLAFNFHPASIFMGDTGSMFLGFVLATVSIKTSAKSGTTVAMLVPIVALGLPIIDTLLAVLRRSVQGQSPFRGDREHIHHRLMSRLVLSHRRTVLLLYGLCCLFALVALALAYANSLETTLLLVGLSVAVAILIRQLGYVSPGAMTAVTETRRHNKRLRQLVRRTGDGLATARGADEIWEAVRPVLDEIAAARLQLRIEGPAFGKAGESAFFEAQGPAGLGPAFDVRIEFGSPSSGFGWLGARWEDGRRAVDGDEELALQVIADAITRILARQARRPRRGNRRPLVAR